MSFRFVPKSVTGNGLILRYFNELGSFQGPLRKRGEDSASEM